MYEHHGSVRLTVKTHEADGERRHADGPPPEELLLAKI